MPSNYTGFDVEIDEDDGTTTPVAAAVVKVYDVTNAAALPDIAADAFGHVAAGALAVDAGTLVRFSVQRADGMCGYTEKITT